MELRLWLCLCALTVDCFTFTTAASTSEFIFRLKAAGRECFYDEVEKNETVVFEYRVFAGGNLDVDVSILSPTRKIIYDKAKSKTDTYIFQPEESGVFQMCFDNGFSAVTGKDVYLFFQAGDEQALRGVEPHPTVLTLMETYADDIHKSLNDVKDMQTHQLLTRRLGIKFAKDLNKKVMNWSALQSCIILVVGIGQVFILRSLFTDKRPSGFVRGTRI